MPPSNFIDNVRHKGAKALQEEVVCNADLMQDMAASDSFAHKYLSPVEVNTGAGYTIRLIEDNKVLCRHGIECQPSTAPETVIFDILTERGDDRTMSIGTTISEKYGLHMSPERSIQFYTRMQGKNTR